MSISTNDPACGGNKPEVENSFFFFLMNERTKNLRRKFLHSPVSLGRGGWRRSNYFYPTRKIFMKQKCLNIFLIELRQTDSRDTTGG